MSIRVLHVVTYMGRGGLETMIMNYYRNIDRNKVQFDFLVHRNFEADYDSEIEALGGKIFRISNLNPFSCSYYRELDLFFKGHPEYKIVHCHLDCMAGIPLFVAKKNQVPARIAHAHSSSQTKDLKYPLKLGFKSIIPKVSNARFACGEKAGNWMFNGAQFSVLNNAINSEDYSFSPHMRSIVREEFAIPDDAFVVGHVGRFAIPKNHPFILECFYETQKIYENSNLLLVGEGDLMEEMKEKAKKLGISEKVIFTGLRSDVNRILQAMDVFLFPSIYEGLPVSLIEAQAAGLPCLISENVPIECKKTDLVKQFSLGEGSHNWAKEILSLKDVLRIDMSPMIKKTGFDICENAKRLQNFYLKAAEKVNYSNSEEAGNSVNNETNRKVCSNIPITVFTPAYNRAHTLPRTYESLKKQKCKSFTWLIVDDGSTDDTAELVKQWQENESEFEIRYIYKENGGMHTAHNTAYRNIDTELNICIDSDDCLAENAIELILSKWELVKDKGYAGIIGLDADMSGIIIGKGFPEDLTETTLMGYYGSGGSGDKKLVYKTEIINEFPDYPVFENERYVALAYKYRLIDQKYKLSVLDEILCNVEYQADGSSGTMWKQYLKYPNGFAFWRKICMQYPESQKRIWIDAVHYVSSSLIARNYRFISQSPRKVHTILMIPFGVLLMMITYLKGK